MKNKSVKAKPDTISTQKSGLNSDTSFIKNNERLLFWFSFFVMSVFSLLLFNIRVSEGGDDSTYMCRAVEFLASGAYPNFQGPLYPIFLSLFIFLFGFKLSVLKVTSMICILVGHWLIYRLLRKRISESLMFAVLGITAVNSWFLYFASQTYSEPLFICVQYLFITLLFKFIDVDKDDWKSNIKPAIFVGLSIVLAALIRTVGWGFLITAVLYLCFKRQYKKALLIAASTIVLWGVWLGVRQAAWGSKVVKSTQITQLLQKHPYQVEEGNETIIGFGERVVANSKNYLSKHFMIMIGFKDGESRETSGVAVVLLLAVFAAAMVRAYKHNQSIFFIGVYLAVMLGITFVILQPLWDQFRLIIIYLPFMILVESYGLYALASLVFKRKTSITIAAVICLLSASLSAVSSTKKIDIMCLRSNMKGDKFEGYSPDWANYLKMCEYVGQTFSDDDYAACRKPNMARIYAGGKKFYGVYTFNSEDPDTLLLNLHKNGVTHVILGSMRRDPRVNDGTIINTLHRYVSFIAQKYPTSFDLVKTIGTQQSEPTYLLKINYEAAGLTSPIKTKENGK